MMKTIYRFATWFYDSDSLTKTIVVLMCVDVLLALFYVNVLLLPTL